MRRLDQLLVSQGLASSRTRAQRLIRHGRVSLPGCVQTLVKPSEKWPEDTRFEVAPDPEERYVSRAGLKLEAVLAALDLRLDGLNVLDVGQSTGGFSDCALHAGARHVIGVEVGHGQLDARLRRDPRVTCLEGINARAMRDVPSLQDALREHPIDLAVMDVSFISQTLILPELAALLPANGRLISLVKPQFELTPSALDKRGVVRDSANYPQVEARLRDACQSQGLMVQHWQVSPITGGDGNQEFLLYAQKTNGQTMA
ncbi:TlyA family RNA methyltransferase [Halomonas sp. CUBES01]|uniref:TlyA family RNA methyltransferase n=1 Tax=Vreelandella gomseomensis TaxID=370766 RepID=A0ABU1GDQ5_9GAMM|nr:MULTISPECIES: TlyA family RNA methyltransferase [Halomonas]MDR5875615.1 TlyA family RNA methyltransferase [Halomonas gomseomensis]MEC4767816.1 TlyA family RNA methyltransferase [Halomonas sp. CUBES01]